MKTRGEIIRALVEPVRDANKSRKLNSELSELLTDIYELAGRNEIPDDLSKLIYAARSAALIQPEFDQLFRSIASIAQDELMTRHRKWIKDTYRLKQDIARAWLAEYVGSEDLAKSIESEVEYDASH